MRPQDSFSLKTGLLDRSDGGVVVDRGLGDNSRKPKFAQTPERTEPQRPRGNPTTARFREDRDRQAGDFLVLVELQVQKTERPIVGRISDHERRARSA
jgi:hypothetical protein